MPVKASLAANGRSIRKSGNAAQVRGQAHPKGTNALSHSCVVSLMKGVTIHCAIRLAVKQRVGAELGNIGNFQGSCTFSYAANNTSFCGFSATAPQGRQFRVWPDHRLGFAALAS